MRKLYLLLSIATCITTAAWSQSYSGPESAEFDYANRRWLIGNTSSHQILSRDSLGNLSVLVNNTGSGPYGIEIIGDTVFCCSGGSIKGYSLSNGLSVFNLNVNGSFLNGLTNDGAGHLIATDFSSKKIILVDVAAQSFTDIAISLPNTPNGIIYDQENNRCVFVNWGTNAPVRAIDMVNYNVTTLINTAMSNCDGITRDGAGRYYISNWGAQSVVRYDSDFVAPPVTVASLLSSPADIFYNTVDDTLAIPNAGNNTVTFVGFTPLTNIGNVSGETGFDLFPNPSAFGSLVKIHSTESAVFNLCITDVNGKLIRQIKNCNGTVNLPTEDLSTGVYFVKVDSNRWSMVKKLLIY